MCLCPHQNVADRYRCPSPASATRVGARRCRRMAAHLVQILIPTHRNDGARYDWPPLKSLIRQLSVVFDGVTAYLRRPGTGLWEEDNTVVRHEIIAVEVVVDRLDKAWWKTYRDHLEADLKQEHILIRSSRIRVL